MRKVNKQLKIAYSILRELSEGNAPTADDYGITKKEFGSTVQDLQDKGYIKQAYILTFDNLENVQVLFDTASITMDGLQFLMDNSLLKKTYNGLKEVREWVNTLKP